MAGAFCEAGYPGAVVLPAGAAPAPVHPPASHMMQTNGRESVADAATGDPQAAHFAAEMGHDATPALHTPSPPPQHADEETNGHNGMHPADCSEVASGGSVAAPAPAASYDLVVHHAVPGTCGDAAPEAPVADGMVAADGVEMAHAIVEMVHPGGGELGHAGHHAAAVAAAAAAQPQYAQYSHEQYQQFQFQQQQQQQQMMAQRQYQLHYQLHYQHQHMQEQRQLAQLTHHTPEGGTCWGGIITGKLANCTPGFKPGTAHMKNKFCDQCRAGFTLPAERVRALLPDDKDRFDNASASGVWKRSIGMAARYRLINQTLHCRGPKLLIFEGPAPTDHHWAELPSTWVWPGGLVRLRTAYGTLVPIETNNTRSRKRFHDDSASSHQPPRYHHPGAGAAGAPPAGVPMASMPMAAYPPHGHQPTHLVAAPHLVAGLPHPHGLPPGAVAWGAPPVPTYAEPAVPVPMIVQHQQPGAAAAYAAQPYHPSVMPYAARPAGSGSVEPAAPPGSELVTPPHAHFAHAGMIAVGAPLDGAPPPHGSAHGALPAALPTLAREAAAREAAVVPEKAPHTMAMAAAAALAAPPPGGGEAAAAAAASRTASGEGEDGGEAAVQPARERLLALRTLLTEGLVSEAEYEETRNRILSNL
eukprot:Transcript_14478.p1 GENE.Transcript_14478~~Transcript_14478.p1  ORF type:complete len:643 (-),score=188.64 Transcript_14478:400-2328(-)